LKLAAAVVSLMLFVAAQRVQTRPMVDFSLFRRRMFLGASVAMLGFASSAQVMMTYQPHAWGDERQAAIMSRCRAPLGWTGTIGGELRLRPGAKNAPRRHMRQHLACPR
jgi:hypothetical protein